MSNKKPQHPDGNQVISDLAKGDMSVLDEVYDRYRDDFLRWAGTHVTTAGQSQLLDVWHDTMIMFYEQVRDRKTTHLTCELRTFLFTIGHRRMLKLLKKDARVDFVEEVDANIHLNGSINALEREEVDEEYRILLQLAVNELPEQSRKILVLRYLEGKSIPEIVELMQYESVNAVSVTLSRALTRLRESISEKRQNKNQWKGETKG